MTERSGLKELISHMLRASLQSYCSVSPRNVSDVAGEPIFVSRRYDSQNLDPSSYFPPLSEESSLHVASSVPSAYVSNFRHVGAESKKKKKKERRVSEIGVCYEAGGDWDGRTCPPASPASPSDYSFEKVKKLQGERLEDKKEKKREKKTKKKKKLLSNSYGFTSSSSEDSDEGGFFSSDEGRSRRGINGVVVDREEETETLFSSRSFSSDSSEFYYHSTHHHTKIKKPQKPRRRGDRSNRSSRSSNIKRLILEDGFRPLVSIITSPATSKEKGMEALRREGFAVVKQSTAPYEDFRSSMMEMIVEKQMLGAKDLERLLHCYLYLNSPHHHRVILEVFSEICEVLFGN